MALQDIKETRRYGHTDERRVGLRENSIPPQTQFAGGGGKAKTVALNKATPL